MNRLARTHRPHWSNRGGILTVATLVCLTIAAALMAITVHGALRARRHAMLEHQLVQTEWLLDAGVRRARAGLQNQSDYQGETWTPAGGLDRFGTATVEIVISTAASESPVATVTATIVESPARARTTRRSHQFSFQPNSTDTSSAE